MQQDTLVKPQQRPGQLFPNITVRRSLIDLERAEEVMRQFEEREKLEQELNVSQIPRARTKQGEPLRNPSIEVDTLLMNYRHIGCTPRASFPDTFSLTILERYYQPISGIRTSFADTADSSKVAALQTITVVKPAIRPGIAHEPRSGSYPASITIILMCGLALLAFIKYHFRKYLVETLKSLFSYRQAQRIFEDRRESGRQAAFLSNILFILMTGFFVSMALPFFGAKPLCDNYVLSILFFALATGLLYFLKATVWRILGFIFMARSFVETYIHNMYMINRNVGLIIFSPVALIPYANALITPYIVYGVIVVFVLSYVLKIWRIFEIILSQNVSIFYFILYLCTLEILPLLLCIKGCKALSEFTLFL